MSPQPPDPGFSAESPAPPGEAALAALDQTRWFAEEVHRHDGQLKAWLRGKYPGVRDVEDVVQESYLRIWKVRATRPIESAKALLFTIARHLALDQVRRSNISPITAVNDLAALPVSEERESVPDVLSRAEKRALLAQAIVALPSRMREVVILHKVEGLAQAEVAQRLGLRAKTVENLVGRGVTRCREFLRARRIDHF